MPIKFTDISWPNADRYWLLNARVPACLITDDTALPGTGDDEGVLAVDILVNRGKLARVQLHGSEREGDAAIVDLGGRQVWPTLIDIHTHLDKGHTVERSPNVDGTFHNARLGAMADRVYWTLPDLRRRMDFGLRCAFAHGVSAIRSHIDTYPETVERNWQAVREMRDQWRGRIDLQAVSLCPIGLLGGEFGDRVADTVAKSHGLLGGVTRSAVGDHGATLDDIDALLDRLFGLAKRHDLDVDLHVDETHDPASATLPSVARAALRHGYQGRVVCGHCCSLSNQPDDVIDRTLDLLAAAEIAIVTLPTVNMYLQDRSPGRTPRWRGVTVIQEMRRRGIRVAAAGDNCRDSFYAYGDHDVLDTFRQAVRIAHLDHPLAGAPALVSTIPASIGKFTDHARIATGAPARLIVLNARTINEIVCRPQSDRVVIREGKRIAAEMPEFSELWETHNGAAEPVAHAVT
ncbi:MAG TPA: cytosine deaminase [Xanthobacteraceae bacterium]|nr:cytosine deaminase [Xanthobacteraceae bacterium]